MQKSSNAPNQGLSPGTDKFMAKPGQGAKTAFDKSMFQPKGPKSGVPLQGMKTTKNCK